MTIQIGAKYRLVPKVDWSAIDWRERASSAFWHGLAAHVGHPVTVIELSPYDSASDNQLYRITGENGWKGAAYASELEPL